LPSPLSSYSSRPPPSPHSFPTRRSSDLRRMSYSDAIATYGSDKPDLRCGMEIHDLSEAFRDAEFRVFKQIVAGGGVVRGFAVRRSEEHTSELQSRVDLVCRLLLEKKK